MTQSKPTEAAGSAVVRSRARGIHRFKPRASVRAQLTMASVLWLSAAIVLGVRGSGWVFESQYPWMLVAVASVAAVLKYRYILSPTALRAITRIDERGEAACAGGFFSWQSWLMVLVMMAGGHALRLTSLPRPILGTLYLTIALALAWGAARFGRAASAPRC